MRVKSRTLLSSRVRRSLSLTMVSRYSSRSAGSAGRPTRSVSANIRMAVSGVFSSCDTLETNCEGSSATRSSRRTSRQNKYAPNASLLYSLRFMIRSRASRHLGILALRHQLVLVNRSRRPRLRFTSADRLLWAWLSQAWRGWRSAVHVVKPETVVAWHRRGFRLFWIRKSRQRCSPSDVCTFERRNRELNRYPRRRSWTGKSRSISVHQRVCKGGPGQAVDGSLIDCRARRRMPHCRNLRECPELGLASVGAERPPL
jgi:hypothetical protein